MTLRVVTAGRRSLLRRREGTAAVELALISPLLMLLLAGIIDFGRAFREEIELASAVAAASQYALLNVATINSAGAAGLATALTGIVANTNGPGWAGASVTVNDGATNAIAAGVTTTSGTAANANSCWCPTGVGVAWSWGSPVGCGSTCVGGGGTLAGKYVTIAGTRSFTAIFTGYGVIGDIKLHQNSVVQAQ
jgi:Flp pilus assembly protein TadG